MTTVIRIVCGDKGELHYSSTPDLGMDICPVCDARTVGMTIEETDKKTLLDILYEADAIQIDDIFVRYFHMECEEAWEPDDIVLDVEVEMDYNMYEYSFSIEELKTAVKRPDSEGWIINGDGMYGGSTITPYKLNEITA